MNFKDALPAPLPPTFVGDGPLGNLRAFQRDPVLLASRMTAELGDIAQVRIGPRWATFVTHPDQVGRVLVDNVKNYSKKTRGYAMLRKVLGDGLVTSEGDFWKRQRRIAQPAFHRQRVAGFAESMVRAATERLDAVWVPAAASGTTLDVAEEMMRITLRVVSETLLSIGVGQSGDVVAEAVPVVLEHVLYRITHPLGLPEFVPTARNRRYKAAMTALDTVVGDIIRSRRALGAREAAAPADLLQMLMDARDTETGEGMSDSQLRDEVMTMYLAGHETTAVALAWSLYELSQHSAWDAKLRAELREVLQGRAPSLADVPKLIVTRQVVDEAMRLHPPVWMLGRTALSDDVVGGYRIPKGRLTFVSPYLTHRHPTFWPDPEKFDPNRFSPEQKERIAKHAYIPFSTGQRKCIGDQFAQLEAVLILAAVASRYTMALTNEEPVTHQAAVTLRPKDGVWMRLSSVALPAAASESAAAGQACW